MKKRYIGAVTGVVVIGVVAFFAFKITNEPAEGVINPVKTAPESLLSKKEDIPVSYEGKYVRFNYPSTYRVLPTPKNTYIETVNLLGKAVGSGEISVNVSQETLAENSAARIRRLQTQTYTEKQLIHPVLKGIVFTKQLPGYEKAAIIEQNNRVVSVVVSSSSGKKLDEIFNALLQSFSWK